MQFQVLASAAANTRHPLQVNGRTYMISDYVGVGPLKGKYVAGNERNDNGLPQGFLVEQPAGAVTPPHFHIHPQFQVVVRGRAHIGKHAASPLSLHYVNGHTPYGPVTAGDEGVLYFTLRRGWDPGPKYMPESRDHLEKGQQRTRVAADMTLESAARRGARGDTVTEPVLDLEADGLAAWIVRAGPGQTLTTPDPSGGDAQYQVVVGGSAIAHGEVLDLWSCAFVSGDEPALSYTAGGDGVELLVCQFPRP